MDWQLRVLLELLDLSKDGFKTVLKSPPIIIGESDRLERDVKKV